MEYGLAKKITAWAHANRDPNKQEDWIQFCMKGLRTLKSFKIFKSEIKKLKTYSGWCPFKGLSNDTTLMQIKSGRTVPLKSANLKSANSWAHSAITNPQTSKVCQSTNRKSAIFIWLIRKSQIRKFLRCSNPQIWNLPIFHHREARMKLIL
jgi:hypothetical protein